VLPMLEGGFRISKNENEKEENSTI
jgi:hypothetical protein